MFTKYLGYVIDCLIYLIYRQQAIKFLIVGLLFISVQCKEGHMTTDIAAQGETKLQVNDGLASEKSSEDIAHVEGTNGAEDGMVTGSRGISSETNTTMNHDMAIGDSLSPGESILIKETVKSNQQHANINSLEVVNPGSTQDSKNATNFVKNDATDASYSSTGQQDGKQLKMELMDDKGNTVSFNVLNIKWLCVF